MALTVRPVESKKDLKDFIDLPFNMFSKDPIWTPPLKQAVRDVLNEEKNPFYKHAKIQKWIATRNGKTVGRIAAVVDDAHNKFHNEQTAFWGFFECEDNQETANALFETAENWARTKNMKVIRGPMNPSTNHECGLQINAFETKPFIMMTQNPAYYVTLVEKAGHAKAKDLLAWLVTGESKYSDKLVARAEKITKEAKVKVRPVNMKDYDNEVERILAVYNDAWETNWGFVPMTPDEFRHMAKEMKMIVIPELLYMVEHEGEVIGFGLCLPDANQAVENIRDGELFPFGIFKLLWNLKVRPKKGRCRILTLGVKKKFQPLGIGSLLYMKYLKEGPALGWDYCEASWILEDNVPMNTGLKNMGAEMYKTYRIYDKAL